jgi:hypothetical protein
MAVQNLEELAQKVAKAMYVVKTLRGEKAALLAKVAGLESDGEDLRAEIVGLKDVVATHESNMAAASEQVEGLAATLAEIEEMDAMLEEEFAAAESVEEVAEESALEVEEVVEETETEEVAEEATPSAEELGADLDALLDEEDAPAEISENVEVAAEESSVEIVEESVPEIVEEAPAVEEENSLFGNADSADQPF